MHAAGSQTWIILAYLAFMSHWFKDICCEPMVHKTDDGLEQTIADNKMSFGRHGLKQNRIYQALNNISDRDINENTHIMSFVNHARELAGRQKAKNPCQRHNLYVDFSSIGWNSWILVPAGYEAFYCAGECTFPLTDGMNATKHAIVQTLVHLTSPDIPKPCCVPTKLSPLQLMYIDDDSNSVSKQEEDMVVEACGCR